MKSRTCSGEVRDSQGLNLSCSISLMWSIWTHCTVQNALVTPWNWGISRCPKDLESTPPKTNERPLKRGQFKKKGNFLPATNFSCDMLLLSKLLSNGILFWWVGASKQRETKPLAYMNHEILMNWGSGILHGLWIIPNYIWVVLDPLTYSTANNQGFGYSSSWFLNFLRCIFF